MLIIIYEYYYFFGEYIMHRNKEIIEDYLLVKGLSKSFAPLIGELFRALTRDYIIIINSSLKREISLNINGTLRTIENMITKLVESEILIRIDRGRYRFTNEINAITNENYKKAILTVNYNQVTKTIKIETEE